MKKILSRIGLVVIWAAFCFASYLLFRTNELGPGLIGCLIVVFPALAAVAALVKVITWLYEHSGWASLRKG
jgi:hypothetical protein